MFVPLYEHIFLKMKKYGDIIKKIKETRWQSNIKAPSRILSQEFIDLCCEIIFPINVNTELYPSETSKLLKAEYLLKTILLPVNDKLENDPEEICNHFFNLLPKIATCLKNDAEAIYKFDPAATSIDEVIAAYPGFYSIMVYRLSHELFKIKIPLVPRLISEIAHCKTGIEISPGAEIGSSFFIDHGTGIVIGETCKIHNNVKIYQGVTLGALQVSKELAQQKRHPSVEDNVIIYSNSTILGGDTVIGHDSIIGGNVFLTKSIPPFSLVQQKSEIKVRSQFKGKEPINFQI